MGRNRRTEYVRSNDGQLVREERVSIQGPTQDSELAEAELDLSKYTGKDGNRRQNEQEAPYSPDTNRNMNSNGTPYRTAGGTVPTYGGPRGAFDQAPKHPGDKPPR